MPSTVFGVRNTLIFSWTLSTFSRFPSVSSAFFLIFPYPPIAFQDGSEIKKRMPIYLSPCLYNLLQMIFWFCGFRERSVLRLKKNNSPVIFDPSRVTQLSWNPRFFFLVHIYRYDRRIMLTITFYFICYLLIFASIIFLYYLFVFVNTFLQGFYIQGISVGRGVRSPNQFGNIIMEFGICIFFFTLHWNFRFYGSVGHCIRSEKMLLVYVKFGAIRLGIS